MSEYIPTEDQLIACYGRDGIGQPHAANLARARRAVDKIKAEVWEECEDSAYFDPETRHQVSHGKNPYREEL